MKGSRQYVVLTNSHVNLFTRLAFHAGQRLDALAERLQARVEEAADSADDTTPSLAQLESTYALLGAKRGVSEATIDVSKQTRVIDWALLREERFF